MGLEQTGTADPNNGKDGLAKSLENFVDDHLATSRGMQNIAMGKKPTAPIPPFDPSHPDNQWPVMVYHPTLPPKTIGKPVFTQFKDGKPVVMDEKEKKRTIAENEAALKSQLGLEGWQKAPYLKPNVRVLTPEEEKAALVKQIDEQNQKLAALSDTVQRMTQGGK